MGWGLRQWCFPKGSRLGRLRVEQFSPKGSPLRSTACQPFQPKGSPLGLATSDFRMSVGPGLEGLEGGARLEAEGVLVPTCDDLQGDG